MGNPQDISLFGSYSHIIQELHHLKIEHHGSGKSPFKEPPIHPYIKSSNAITPKLVEQCPDKTSLTSMQFNISLTVIVPDLAREATG